MRLGILKNITELFIFDIKYNIQKNNTMVHQNGPVLI